MNAIGIRIAVGVVCFIIGVAAGIAASEPEEPTCVDGGNRHKFSPRYSQQRTGIVEVEGGFFGVSSSTVKDLMYRKVYDCDVCEWCGIKSRKEAELR